MGLRLRFNLILTVVFALGLLISGVVSYDLLQQNAREEVVHTANLMIQAARAFRTYTVDEIRPLLANQLNTTFLPQTVPAYAATQTLGALPDEYREFLYKEATLNPTNPRDRAVAWEADLVQEFKREPDRGVLSGIRSTPGGPSLYIASPIKITSEPCLTCHSTPAAAPASMLALYGNANGFGWKLNDIVGAQIVSVPMSVPQERALQDFLHLHGVAVRAVRGVVRRAQPGADPDGDQTGRRPVGRGRPGEHRRFRRRGVPGERAGTRSAGSRSRSTGCAAVWSRRSG